MVGDWEEKLTSECSSEAEHLITNQRAVISKFIIRSNNKGLLSVKEPSCHARRCPKG